MIEEVIAQKITSLQRCIVRAREELATAGADFGSTFPLKTRQS